MSNALVPCIIARSTARVMGQQRVMVMIVQDKLEAVHKKGFELSV